MANSLEQLLVKDTRAKKWLLRAVVVIFVLFALRSVQKSQALIIKELQREKALVAAIPEMKRVKAQARMARGVSLQGIIRSETEPMAVINDAMVKIGDRVGANLRLVSIKEKSVIVNDGEKDYEIKLPE